MRNVCKPAEIESADAAASALDALDPIHPGFRTSRNVVLHKFGTDPNYDAWRSQSLTGPQPTQAAAPRNLRKPLSEPIVPSVQVFDVTVANSNPVHVQSREPT